MINKEFLMIPGPTPLPPRVVAAMTQPMINHRGPRFKEIFKEAIDITKELINCSQDVFLVPSSGTGAMELAVENFTQRGEKVLVVDTGFFGERFYRINVAKGRNAIRVQIPWGRAVLPEEITEILTKDKDVKAVFLTHNETSSTIINNIKEISARIKEVSDGLIVVDAVSSIGITKIDMDNWGIDIIVGASQKGLMSPPGIGIVATSKRAVEYVLSNESEAFYFSVKDLKKNADIGQPFTTFPVSDFFGLREGLGMLHEEGFDNVYKRHVIYKNLVRVSLKELNLQFVANDNDASPCVTGVYAPDGIDADQIVEHMRERYNVEIASGQGQLKGRAFRIGHMGFINSNDLLVTVGALECTLRDLGYDLELGKGMNKFLELRTNYSV
jgi:aspartate aminotransferase-like enzyme